MYSRNLEENSNFFFSFFPEIEGKPNQRQNEYHKREKTRPHRGEAGPLGRENTAT